MTAMVVADAYRVWKAVRDGERRTPEVAKMAYDAAEAYRQAAARAEMDELREKYAERRADLLGWLRATVPPQ